VTTDPASVGLHALDAALAYAAAGLAIFPTNGKTPRIGSWPTDATTDPATIRTWFRRWPDAGIGWAIPAGVIVADLDPPAGPDYARAAGGLPHDGPISRTPRDGWHVVMALPDDGPWAQRQLAPSVDSRIGGRGYIVLPDGRPGRSWHQPPADLADLVTPDRLPAAPTWVVDEVRDRPRPAPDPDRPLRGSDQGSRRRRETVVRAESVGPPVEAGNRHAFFVRVGRSLRGLGASADDLVAALDRLNGVRCQPPIAGREWDTERAGLVRWLVEAISPDPVEPGPVDDGPVSLRLERVVDSLAAPADDAFLIDGLLRPGTFAILAGYEGDGKSHLARQMSIEVAAGRPVLATFAVGGPIVSVWLDAENGRAEDDRRVRRLADDLGTPAGRVADRLHRLTTETDSIDLRDEAWRAGLLAELDRVHGIEGLPVLLILDSADSLISVDLWGSAVKPYIAAIRGLRRDRPWLTVVLLTHTNKPAKTPTGKRSTEHRDLVDIVGNMARQVDAAWIIELPEPTDRTRLRLRVRKRVPRADLTLIREPDRSAWRVVDDDGEVYRKVPPAVVAAWLAGHPEGVTVAQTAAHFEVGHETARRYLRDAEATGSARIVEADPEPGAGSRQRGWRVYPVAPGTATRPDGGEAGDPEPASSGLTRPHERDKAVPRPAGPAPTSSTPPAPLGGGAGGSEGGGAGTPQGDVGRRSAGLNLDPAATWAAIDAAGGVGRPDALDALDSAIVAAFAAWREYESTAVGVSVVDLADTVLQPVEAVTAALTRGEGRRYTRHPGDGPGDDRWSLMHEGGSA
jgi:hypothetical protein